MALLSSLNLKFKRMMGSVDAKLALAARDHMPSKMVIFGAGEMGKKVIHNLQTLNLDNQLVALVDSKAEFNSFEVAGLTVQEPAALETLKFDTLLIASERFIDGIAERIESHVDMRSKLIIHLHNC